MTEIDAISTAIAEMREVQRTIAIVTDERGDQWRNKLISLRRSLSGKLAAVSSLVDKAAAVICGGELDELCGRLARVRSALAEHQSQWPAVSADPQAADYRLSASRLREACDDLDIALAALVIKRA